MLDAPTDVIRCLVTYTDWYQPVTGSFLQIAGARGRGPAQGLRPGLIESLDERAELCRRMHALSQLDRQILFLWYVEQLRAEDIARAVGISRRQCFRRRARSVQTLADLGKRNAAA